MSYTGESNQVSPRVALAVAVMGACMWVVQGCLDLHSRLYQFTVKERSRK